MQKGLYKRFLIFRSDLSVGSNCRTAHRIRDELQADGPSLQVVQKLLITEDRACVYECARGSLTAGSLRKVAKRKLDGLNAAEHINDLLAPPGNRLELLKGDLAGRWSIRINDQFRIVFRWDKGLPNPSEVEIRDYH